MTEKTDSKWLPLATAPILGQAPSAEDTQQTPIRVLVVDDHPLFRRGVINLLESEEDLLPVGEVGSIAEALEWLGHNRADVVLLDNKLPGGNGIPNLPRLLEKQADLQAVILTISDSKDEFLRAIRFGACGYILKDAAPERLIEGVRNAARHDFQVSEHMMRGVGAPGAQSEGTAEPPITVRERELLGSLCQGHSNKEIAKGLGLSPNTVRNSLQRMQERFLLQNRVQLALFARDNGLL